MDFNQIVLTLIVFSPVTAAVIILFLLHLRSALIPIVSLPVAVALAFIPLVAMDVPATIMSLGGIAIAIGATVDAELVMIEASHKRLERAPPGADRHALAGGGAGHHAGQGTRVGEFSGRDVCRTGFGRQKTLAFP